MPNGTDVPVATIRLEEARWKLAVVWFPGCGLLFLILVIQSLGGAYGKEPQRAWGWALPNFLPTLALMISVFAAEALKPDVGNTILVRKQFSTLSIWLSWFYLIVLFITVLSQPLVAWLGTSNINRIEMLEASNLWLGPLQGLVVVSLGVLFFLKKEGAD